ncbi:hypothetical protein MXB_2425 [Myxobolus squamalis]|nr:hypothetical protein MXB_2425 [Myxobolus squamalis]
MEDFKNITEKLEPFKNRFVNPSTASEKTTLNKEENELIVNCCKSITEINRTKSDTGKLIKEALELMFIMTNHESNSIRIVICKYIFKIIKYFLKAYRRFIFHSILKTINHVVFCFLDARVGLIRINCDCSLDRTRVSANRSVELN